MGIDIFGRYESHIKVNEKVGKQQAEDNASNHYLKQIENLNSMEDVLDLEFEKMRIIF